MWFFTGLIIFDQMYHGWKRPIDILHLKAIKKNLFTKLEIDLFMGYNEIFN